MSRLQIKGTDLICWCKPAEEPERRLRSERDLPDNARHNEASFLYQCPVERWSQVLCRQLEDIRFRHNNHDYGAATADLQIPDHVCWCEPTEKPEHSHESGRDVPDGQVRSTSGLAEVSGTYLSAVEVSSSWSSGPDGDQSTASTSFTPTLESVTVTASQGETFLLLASAQLWNSGSDVGSSIAICDQGGQRVSGDMFTLGATMTHRHAATAIAVVTPGAGSFTYTLDFKTDPGGQAWVSGMYLLAVKFDQPIQSSGPHGDQSTTSTSFTPTLESLPFTVTGGEQLLLIGSAQVWNDDPTIGSSIAIARDGVRISGDHNWASASSCL